MKEYYFRLKMISEELTNDRKEFLIGTYEGTRSNALAYFRRKTKGNVYAYMIEQYHAVYYVEQYDCLLAAFDGKPYLKCTPLQLRATQIGQ